MAGLAGIIDPDPRTRTAFLDAVNEHFGRHYGGSPHPVDIGILTCRWRACRSAPVSSVRRGPWSVWVLGNIDRTDTRRQSHAELIADHIENRGLVELACYSGFFLAIVGRADDTYVVSDRLGMFPCYYMTRGEVLVLGSSSYIPVLHPALPRRLNFKALLGHLLCMVEVLGEPLWQQCHRLGVGEILHFRKQDLRTIRTSSIPVSDAHFGLPYEAQLDRAHAAMMEACEQYRDKPVSVLFSGGLDSRLLAGYLSAIPARVEAAYTFGLPSDIEFRCARRACREVRWRQVLLPVDFLTFPSLAHHQIVTEQLANGLSNLPAWTFPADGVLNTDVPLVNGFQGDPILGGSNIPWAYDPGTRRYSFDRLFEQHNRRGISPALLCRLFPGAETPRLIAEIVAQMRDLYESLPGYEFQKVWQFTLLHRLRFHIAGILGRIARTVWPSAPYTHEAVLAAAGGMPAASLLGRRLQKDLLASRFPRLAALPLDSNSFFPGPLTPSLGYRLRNRVRRMTGLHKLYLQGGERRFFYRLYDMNNPGWRLVREEGLRSCDGLWRILDLDCLRELLPDTRVRIEVEDAIIDASGRKSLLGFVLWHKRYADVLAQGGPPSICPEDPGRVSIPAADQGVGAVGLRVSPPRPR